MANEQHAELSAIYQFNFTNVPRDGYVTVLCDKERGVPRYEDSGSYGFVEWTLAQPPRKVHCSGIVAGPGGFEIHESQFDAMPGTDSDNYNGYGMAFRIKVPRGAYTIQVRMTSDPEDTTVAVSGMNADSLSKTDYWDAARLVPNRTRPRIEGKVWTYDYVSGRDYLDIEIEPKRRNVTVGIAEIVLTPLPPKFRAAQQLPAIYTLGDSTVKSYIFEEAPMSGWGQVFDHLFDLDKVNVVNYSMGGRSFKSSYTEGRFNDILMTGRSGDYLLIQFGHNDESADEDRRFGRGSTEAMYRTFIEEIYMPAIISRGLVPVLVTPMSRVDGTARQGHVYTNSFHNRRFPDILREMSDTLGVTLIDLNEDSIDYYNEIGPEAVTALFMSIEAGETPGKTNDGSYANGHPSRKIDGTHFKEGLSKQFARLVVSRLAALREQGDPHAASITSFLKSEVKEAIRRNNWSVIYPEITADTETGRGSYYRNQIEKLLQIGVMNKDANGKFNPEAIISCEEFAMALAKGMNLESSLFTDYEASAPLTREVMAGMLDDAYHARFAGKPGYMTDYNGNAVTPDCPDYDPYLNPGQRGLMYYPVVSYEQLLDTREMDSRYSVKCKDAYQLGLIRSETGIQRGLPVNGVELQPKALVNREKAAKSLYYMWVLRHPVHTENDDTDTVNL